MSQREGNFFALTESGVSNTLRRTCQIAEMKRKQIYFYFVAAILSVLLSSSASGQLTKLNVGYSAISAEQ
jgi:ABC-type arginine transport system permease subunit